MRTHISFDIKKEHSFEFYGDELNKKHDFIISTEGHNKEVDFLLFFDSRGICKDFKTSLSNKIIKNLPKNKSYLLVSRPLEITTWMTLYNFVLLNKIVPKKIITNMGFVDFTPKKSSIIEKSIIQYDLFFSKKDAEVNLLEKYYDENKSQLILYQQNYPSKFVKSLEELLKSSEIIILNTPLLKKDYNFERKRPFSFFNAVKKSNQFNHKLKINKTVIDFERFDNRLCYDGVHYTSKGNERLFLSIKKYL
ncbi:MAG: hypothetical protein ACJ0PU_02890 [Flavobacteriaceae bacterium]